MTNEIATTNAPLITHPAGCSCSDRYFECGENWRNCERTAAYFTQRGVEFSDETLKRVFHVYGGYPFTRMRCLIKALHAARLLDERVRGLCLRMIGLLDDSEHALEKKARLVLELGELPD